MQTSRRLLLSGLCFFMSCCMVRGVVYLPPEAIHFPKCDPSKHECPANSSCEQTNPGYYCACFLNEKDKFYNDKDKTSITYPGGECLELCEKGQNFPCACRTGSVRRFNENGLYICASKCRNDSDCPSGASCKRENCYCKDVCKQQIGDNCITLVKLDEVCEAPSTTTRLLLTSVVNMGNTTVDTQPGTTAPQTTTPQPVADRCQINSRTNLEAKECEKHNNTDSVCTFLKSIVHITEDACERNNTNNSVQVVASQITHLLNETINTLDSSELQTVITAITENVETSLLAAFSADLRNQQINTSEIEAEMKVPQDHCGGESSMNLIVHGNKMEVPCSLVNFEGGGAMFISYKGLSTRLNGSILANVGDSEPIAGEEVISLVVGGVITHINTKNLDPPVTFTLKHLRAVKPLHNLSCVFWDTQEEVWSTSGCKTQPLEHTGGTHCVCTHLSTFAVLMAPTEIQVDTGLNLLSFIGLSISLVCLFLSFLTFILCRSLRSAHTSVLTVLCGCLFLGQLLVLVGLRQTWNKILCSVIAGSLQFLFLCAFCWMSLESILLFLTVRNLRAVNYMSSQRSHFPYVCLIGFGIPAIIMIMSASLYPHIYGNQKHCWLKISHIWSFLGPVCLFISVNFILLILTFWLLRKKLASLNSNVSTLKHTRLLTFKALSQLFILGCTWVIGLFQFGSGSLFVSYIFTICNSLQGMYIFLVHCLLNHQVREEYRRVFCRVCSKKTTSETVSGSTLPMTVKTSQMSEISKEDVLNSLKTKN